MLRYPKGPEPPCLVTLRTTPGATWKSPGATERGSLRAALVRDQGALCAYCQQRVSPDQDHLRIDHVQPRSAGGAVFAWSNLVGSCNGEAPGGPSQQTCDPAKANNSLATSPVAGQALDPTASLRYHANGEAQATDPRVEADLTTLNLNAPHLVRTRREHIKALQGWMQKRSAGAAALQHKLDDLTALSGKRATPSAFTLAYHVARWLRRRS